jgi:hypothetical protein
MVQIPKFEFDQINFFRKFVPKQFHEIGPRESAQEMTMTRRNSLIRRNRVRKRIKILLVLLQIPIVSFFAAELRLELKTLQASLPLKSVLLSSVMLFKKVYFWANAFIF